MVYVLLYFINTLGENKVVINEAELNKIISLNYLYKDNKPVYQSINNKKEESIVIYDLETIFPENYKKKEIMAKIGHGSKHFRKNLSYLVQFLDLYKYLSQTGTKVPSIPIACTSEYMVSTFGYDRQASRIIELAKRVNLLACVDESFQFNAYHPDFNKSKKYVLNKKVQKIILELVQEYNIVHKKFCRQYKNPEPLEENIEHSENYKKLYNDLKVSSKLRIADPCGHKNQKDLNKTIETILLDKYPQIKKLRDDVNWINSQPFYLEHPEIQDKADFNISYSQSGLINSIGFRVTNGICSMKAHENGINSGRMWRKDYLQNIFGYNNYESFDVKASIYQLTYALNNGIWLDNEIDLYSIMFGHEFDNPEHRNMFKLFCMPMYFERSSKTAAHHMIMKAHLLDHLSKESIYNNISESRSNLIQALGGKTYDAEIFLHESAIYTAVKKKLMELGYEVIQVYDGFYSKKRSNKYNFQKDIRNILSDVVYDYLTKYKSYSYINSFYKDNDLDLEIRILKMNDYISYLDCNSMTVREESNRELLDVNSSCNVTVNCKCNKIDNLKDNGNYDRENYNFNGTVVYIDNSRQNILNKDIDKRHGIQENDPCLIC